MEKFDTHLGSEVVVINLTQIKINCGKAIINIRHNNSCDLGIHITKMSLIPE